MKISFIVWFPYDRRPDLLAQALGASVHYIHSGRSGRLPQAPVRYVLQGVRTWLTLRRERPEVIFVQNPPIFAVVLVYVYAKLHGAQFIIDSHSAAFLSKKWRWSLPLHRWLSRHALLTIVPNTDLAVIVAKWGYSPLILGFVPGDYPRGEPYPVNGDGNVAVISSFHEDEPLDVIFRAADRLPDATFYVTGNADRAPPALLARKPDNCHLTGYLPYEQYVGLLRTVDAALVLTTRDHTLLMGGFEAVSLGTPLITSDWPILQKYFSSGTVHVPNTVDGICEGVRRAQRRQETLRREIAQLREKLLAEWEEAFAELHSILPPDMTNGHEREHSQMNRPS